MILIDSSNLDPKAGKATPDDEAAVQHLVQLTGVERTYVPRRTHVCLLHVAVFNPGPRAAMTV